MSAGDDPRIGTIAAVFRLLGDPTRLRVLLACLDEIATRIGASQPLVSHHLRQLREARMVRGERHQRRILYATADDHVSGMLVDMLEHAGEESCP